MMNFVVQILSKLILIMRNVFRNAGIKIFFILFIVAFTAQKEDDILFWTENHRLTFDDFQGKPEQSDTTLYESSPNMMTHKLGAIIKSIDVHLSTQRGKTVFTIYAGMQKNQSWIKYPGDSITLSHEQGHFDICEIYARILRRDIQRAKSLSEAKDIYEKVSADEENEQDKYDEENTFQSGGITDAWRDKILNRLKELEAFNKPVITIPIDK